MGLFEGLFAGPAPDAPEAQRLLVAGRAALWKGDAAAAEKALTQAARGHARPALARAYLSLARRMDQDFPGALKDADAALALDADCSEAHAARAAALLSLKKLIPACLAYNEAARRPPHDLDGHALRLLMVALFAETIAAAKEDGDGLRLDFLLTPATRCAIRTLDGRARLALDETANAPNSTVVEIALGAAYYFAGFAAARDEWARAAESFPGDGSNAAIRESLRLLSRAPAA
jgi:hypothetical protein